MMCTTSNDVLVRPCTLFPPLAGRDGEITKPWKSCVEDGRASDSLSHGMPTWRKVTLMV